MHRRLCAIAAATSLVVLVTQSARAELREHRAGAHIVGVLPALAPSDRTEALSAGPGLRLSYGYGVLHHRLSVLMQATAWSHGGALKGYRYRDSSRGGSMGTLHYSGRGYRGTLGLSWQAISGYSMAPYLRLLVGYQWVTYREQSLFDSSGKSFGLEMADTGESSATLGAGFSLEKRLFDAVLVGFSADYVRATSKLYRGDLSVSLVTSYYWF